MDLICRVVKKRSKEGRRFSIVVVSEGAKPIGGDMTVQRIVEESTDPIRLGGIGNKIAEDIEKRTGLESRVTVLGHVQRGGTPTAYDRVLATRFGVKAAELCHSGVGGVMVAVRGSDIVAVPLSDISGKMRLVDTHHPLVQVAKHTGACLGAE